MSAQAVSVVDRPSARSVLSCTFCRQKKLKCDRRRPCGCCTKRGLVCTYIGPPPPQQRQRLNSTRSTKKLNERIRQLEGVISSLKTGSSLPTPLPNQSPESMVENPGNASESVVGSLERMRVGDGGVSCVSEAHWAALQHSIEEIRKCMSPDSDETDNMPESSPRGSALLLGSPLPFRRTETIALLPSRQVADRLVSRFFNSMEPAVLLIHAPTFQQEYEDFWTQSQNVSSTWLALLFSILCLAIYLDQRSEAPTPESMGDDWKNCDKFRVQAARCLIDAKYTTPTRYTLEAMLLYAYTEYFRSLDSPHEIWVMVGIITRLAMRIGLHRDPAHYPKMSCFQGEMRRRIWALLTQLDSLFSYQMGLPRMTRSEFADTQFPQNLLDADFDQNSSSLPPARPDTDATPVSYLIAKSRLVAVFDVIIDHVDSALPSSYQIIIQLDQRLKDARAAASPHLQFRSIAQSVTELPHIIMRRYQLELLYEKSRCILHRRSLTEGRVNPQFSSSRRSCIDAAMNLLKHQADLDTQAQPGGVLSQSRWFVSSLNSHDFILAAMILCLELHYIFQEPNQYEVEGRSSQECHYTREDFISALQISHRIWANYRLASREAMQAWKSISIMLEKARIPRPEMNTPVTPAPVLGEMINTSDAIGGTPRTDTLASSIEHGPESLGDITIPELVTFDGMTSLPQLDYSNEDATMHDIWDFSGPIDWHVWDTAVQNSGGGSKAEDGFLFESI